MAKPTMGACVKTERFYLGGGIEFENRSNSGVWNICSYESLRPIDSSSQSGNFLSRLNTTHSLKFLSVSRGVQIIGADVRLQQGVEDDCRQIWSPLGRFTLDQDRLSESPTTAAAEI